MRIALTVVGGVICFGLWPLLLAVPAIVLQFRPSSSAWFAVTAHEAAGPTGDTGPSRNSRRPPDDWDEEDEQYWQGR